MYDDLHDCIIRLGIWQAFDLKISWSHTHNNHHIFGRGIWEKEIVSAKCHTKQLWVYMYVSIQQYKRIGMWAAVIWIDEDMKNLESTLLLATSLYFWLPNQSWDYINVLKIILIQKYFVLTVVWNLLVGSFPNTKTSLISLPLRRFASHLLGLKVTHKPLWEEIYQKHLVS